MNLRVPAHVLSGMGAVAPTAAGCACCGERAGWTRTEPSRPFGPRLHVPYCEACRAHVAADVTRRVAVTASTGLLSLSLVALLPLVFAQASPGVVALLVGVLSATPALIALVAYPRPSPGHSAGGRAAWWGIRGALFCTSRRFAEVLAGGPGAPLAARPAWPQVGSFSLYAVVGLALLVAPFLHAAHSPDVWVLNTGPEPFRLLVDGREVARVEPSVVEGPHAGLWVRAAVGRRHLVVTDLAGNAVAEETVLVQAGRTHLYAPIRGDVCFWIESTRYGRASADEGPSREPLGGPGRFWALPEGIDLWFTPAPAALADERSTGGVLRGVRQGTCAGGPGLQRPNPDYSSPP